MQRVVIVGAGVSGLALAYRLQQATPQVEITILEQSNRVGGAVWTVDRDGFRVECGPNGFLDTNPATLELCKQLGLADRLIPASESARRNRYLYVHGKLHCLPASLTGFIGSKVLSWRGKWNLLAEPFRKRRRESTDESIHSFLRRRAGREAAEVLGDALVTGIFAGDAKVLSARACLPRLVALEEQYGSLLRGSLWRAWERRRSNATPPTPGTMWSFREGLAVLVESLATALTRPPLRGVAVRKIVRQGPGWQVFAQGNECWPADVLVLACPAYQQAALLEELDTDLAGLIQALAYNRVAVVGLGYREKDVPCKLNGFGFLAPTQEKLDLLGAQWCSSIYPERAPDGMVLIRVMCGGWHRPEIAGWEDERLLAAIRAALQRTMAISSEPVFHHIARWDRAIPQYRLGHTERVAQIEKLAARHHGLILAGNAYHGVALNDCTAQAERLAAKIAAALAGLQASGIEAR